MINTYSFTWNPDSDQMKISSLQEKMLLRLQFFHILILPQKLLFEGYLNA